MVSCLELVIHSFTHSSHSFFVPPSTRAPSETVPLGLAPECLSVSLGKCWPPYGWLLVTGLFLSPCSEIISHLSADEYQNLLPFGLIGSRAWWHLCCYTSALILHLNSKKSLRCYHLQTDSRNTKSQGNYSTISILITFYCLQSTWQIKNYSSIIF